MKTERNQPTIPPQFYVLKIPPTRHSRGSDASRCPNPRSFKKDNNYPVEYTLKERRDYDGEGAAIAEAGKEVAERESGGE